MRPSGSSSQRSSISDSTDAAPGLVMPASAGTNFSSGCCVSVGNEFLADGVLLSDIASIALGELNFGSPSFFGPNPASTRREARQAAFLKLGFSSLSDSLDP